MEEKFKAWMIRSEGKLESTAINYSRAIHNLSEHYSNFTGIATDIYTVYPRQLKVIRDSYESNGRFAEEGHFRHGLNRAAIKAFYRYRQSNPLSEPIKIVKRPKKTTSKRKKTERITFIQKISRFFRNFFNKTFLPKAPSDSFTGTRKQISKHLIACIDDWEKEVHKKYKSDNPHCQRCKSIEFPEVVEKPAILSKDILKMVLKDFPKKAKQKVLKSNLERKFKSQVASGDRLIVLCRSCKQKDEARKVESYRHEIPPVMRKGPPELKY